MYKHAARSVLGTQTGTLSYYFTVCPIYKFALLGVPATSLLHTARNKNIIPTSRVVFWSIRVSKYSVTLQICSFNSFV